MATNSQTKIGIIYAGGTFGSHGEPLHVLSAEIFLPVLSSILQQEFNDFEQIIHWQILDNTLVKDSSQLTPSDFVHFYALILQHYQQGIRQFVLLTGTDTLSYLSAFLAESLAKSDICLVVTGAMQPLLQPTIADYQLNLDSDASDNLRQSCYLATQGNAGVWVCFSQQQWHAQTVQKIHSHDLNAFVGNDTNDYPANSFRILDKDKRQDWLDFHLGQLSNTVKNLQQVKIIPLFILPTTTDSLTTLLQSALKQKANAVILLGFGAGNLPYSEALAELLKQAGEQNCLVVIGTQCPFGGVSISYEAGAWLVKCGVLSSGNLALPAIFARLLWLYADDMPIDEKQTRWQAMLDSKV